MDFKTLDPILVIQAITSIFFAGVLTQNVRALQKRSDKTEAELDELRRDFYKEWLKR